MRAISEFAALRFDARAPIGPDGDIVDAVAAGVNFLGEELGASSSEIERRVVDRTAELTRAMQQLDHRALHDELTGLPNRGLAWAHLSHRMALADRRATGFAVLFLDVDDFKVVNDTGGHAAGDRLLVEIAARIQAALRSGDAAARVGGDEFLVMLDDVATSRAALVVAEHLCKALGAPYDIAPVPWVATVSVGVALGPSGFATADDVVAAADTAMYEAKRRGGGRCVLYRDDLPGRSHKPPVGPHDRRRSRRRRSRVQPDRAGSTVGPGGGRGGPPVPPETPDRPRDVVPRPRRHPGESTMSDR